jgi:hypothetical protein
VRPISVAEAGPLTCNFIIQSLWYPPLQEPLLEHYNVDSIKGPLDQSWYWTVLGTGPLVRTASSRGGPVLDLGTGRPVLS